MFTLSTCAPIAGYNVYSFGSERELLGAWANIVNFDLPYLLNRADFLRVAEDKADSMAYAVCNIRFESEILSVCFE